MNKTFSLYVFGVIAAALTAVLPSQTLISNVAFLIIMPLAAIWIWRNQGRSFEESGYSLSQGWFRYLAIGLLIGLGIPILFVLIRQLGGWITLTQRGYSTSILISLLAQMLIRLIVIVAIEEFVFRGFFLNALTQKVKIWAAILLSSLLWGLSHLGSIVNAGYSIGDIFIAIASYLAWGIALSMCYLIAKRSLWLPYGFHLGAILGFSFIGLYFDTQPSAPQWWIGHHPWSSVSGLIGSLVWAIVALVAYRLARPISGGMLTEEIEKVDTSETDAVSKAHLLLNVLTGLILATLIILVFGNFTDRNTPPDWVFVATLILLILSPLLCIRSIIVGITALKRGSERQKKVAKRYISWGILGLIISGGLVMFLLDWLIGIIA